MEEVTIPGWALLVFATIILPWLVWLTNRVNSNDKDIAINTAADIHVTNELTKIYNAIDNQNQNSKERFDKMEAKFDLFIFQENSYLKQIAKQ